jgi:hypothetical protein
MGKKELSGRLNWENISGKKAEGAEQNLYDVFNKAFEGTIYKLHEKPKHFKNLYAGVELDNETLGEIFNPGIDLNSTSWGILPDFAIENTKTGKFLFGEIKRQDGWVEGKDPSAGRGNAHERLCKLFTPGLLNTYRKIGGIKDKDILPFWIVFEGDITRDPKRVREITFWFNQYYANFFMWRPNASGEELLKHFNDYLKKYLD